MGEISTSECARRAHVCQKFWLPPSHRRLYPRQDATCIAMNGEVTTYDVEILPKKRDTNGAGDASVGGFLSGLFRGKDMRTCVLAGHYSARVIIQTSGYFARVEATNEVVEHRNKLVVRDIWSLFCLRNGINGVE